MYKLKCLNCGKEFLSERKTRKFCGYECFAEYKQKQAIKRKIKFLRQLLGETS
jgi:reverse gyrase